VFAIVTGVCTLVGVALTLVQMKEMERVITSFDELHERLCDLIEEAREQPDDFVRYCAYTPLTGCLALRPDRTDRLERKVRETGRHRPHNEPNKPYKVSIVCLEADDHEYWLRLYIDRPIPGAGKMSAEAVKHACDRVEALLERVKTQVNGRIVAVDEQIRMHNAELAKYGPDNAANEENALWRENDARRKECEVERSQLSKLVPVRLKFERLLGFYFFCSNRKAIVVAPLFLPLPPGTPMEVQTSRLFPVQMLGVETSDRLIVDSLGHLHELYRSLGDTAEEVSQTVQGSRGSISEKLRTAMDQLMARVQSRFAEGDTLLAKVFVTRDAPPLVDSSSVVPSAEPGTTRE
ncbi:MAG: hypothetical protein NTY19_02920, partial [Planctomycetota bacterium]|nr:hypothetical protein [Planctomycetota bacterium]